MANLPSIFNNMTAFENAQRTAKALMTASVLPKEYTGNIGNMLIALDVAGRTGMGALEVMQQLYIVHGKPAWSSKALLAMILNSGQYNSPEYVIEKDKTGKVISCCLKMVRTSDKKEVVGPVVSWTMAESEGWTKKSGSKWLTMPETMFRYRAISMFANSVCPDITLGISTKEELEDIKDVTPEAGKAESLSALIAKATEETPTAEAAPAIEIIDLETPVEAAPIPEPIPVPQDPNLEALKNFKDKLERKQ